jgi:ribosomal protein L2
MINYFDSKNLENYVTVRIPSKKNRIINTSAYATIGIVSTKNKNIANLKKAGRTR